MKTGLKPRSGAQRTFLFLFLIIGIAGSAAVLMVRLASQRNHAAFSTLAASASSKVQSGNHSDAYRDIGKAVRFASSMSEWMELLTLSYQVSEVVRKPELFARVALKAASDLPGNEELWALGVHGLLQCDRNDEAFRIAEKYLRSARFLTFRAEAAIRAGKQSSSALSIQTDENLAALLLSAGSGGADPDLYLKAGTVTGESSFIKNAALLYAGKGRIADSLRTFRTFFPPDSAQTLPAELREIGSLLAYDVGETGTALAYLGSSVRNMPLDEHFLLLSADILSEMSDFDAARNLYLRQIERSPDFTWLSYLNAAWILRNKGDSAGAVRLLEQGLRIFPDDSRLTLAYARLLYTIGEGEKADRFLDGYFSRFPENAEVRLLKLKISLMPVLPERLEAELWALYNGHPESEEALRFLCWYLLGKGDREGLRTVFTNLPERFASSGSALFYGSVFLCLSGDAAGALDGFLRLAKSSPSWPVYFNIGVLHKTSGRLREAELAFSESLRLYNLGSDKRSSNPSRFDSLRSRLLCALGGVHAAAGRYEEMQQLVTMALVLDPSNLEAYTLLKSTGPSRGGQERIPEQVTPGRP